MSDGPGRPLIATTTQPINAITFEQFTPTRAELALLKRVRERQGVGSECRIVIEVSADGGLTWFVSGHREG